MYVPGRCLKCDKNKIGTLADDKLNGKVVARFWCDKVGEIEYKGFGGFAINMPSHIYNSFVDKFYSLGDLLRASCLPYDEFHNYLKCQSGKAIHITKLEIFDKPKEISEFHKVGYQEELKELQAEMEEFEGIWDTSKYYENFRKKFQLTRAPRCGWCYIDKYLENN